MAILRISVTHCVHVASGDRGQHGRDFPAGMPGGGENCFFGVFDGHGGSTVSKYLGESMLECIASTDEYVLIGECVRACVVGGRG